MHGSGNVERLFIVCTANNVSTDGIPYTPPVHILSAGVSQRMCGWFLDAGIYSMLLLRMRLFVRVHVSLPVCLLLFTNLVILLYDVPFIT